MTYRFEHQLNGFENKTNIKITTPSEQAQLLEQAQLDQLPAKTET